MCTMSRHWEKSMGNYCSQRMKEILENVLWQNNVNFQLWHQFLCIISLPVVVPLETSLRTSCFFAGRRFEKKTRLDSDCWKGEDNSSIVTALAQFLSCRLWCFLIWWLCLRFQIDFRKKKIVCVVWSSQVFLIKQSVQWVLTENKQPEHSWC